MKVTEAIEGYGGKEGDLYYIALKTEKLKHLLKPTYEFVCLMASLEL
jgi:hypothetical protein